MMLTLVLVWTFAFVRGLRNDQSLSFSPPSDSSTVPTHSFWHGSIPSTLLNKDIRLRLYINKQNGFLFYAIDNLYKSLWVEFYHENIVISYYNFRNENVNQHSYNSKILCKSKRVTHVTLNLKFSLVKNILHISCNRNKAILFYSIDPKTVNNSTLRKFLGDMRYPVPFFSSRSANVTHIWIGNTPSANNDSYRNQQLKSQEHNLQGCVHLFTEDFSPLNLTSSGHRHGNMIEPFCNLVCSPNKCFNDAQCVELWRGRFTCRCGLSKYVGKYCNESFGVAFDGFRTVTVDDEDNFHTLKIVFTQMNLVKSFQGSKIFSIRFVFNQYLHVYVDRNRSLKTRFTDDDSKSIDQSFSTKIRNNNTFILFIEVKGNNMTFQLVNSDKNENEQRTISGNLANLIYKNVLIGDTHDASMKRIVPFTGCISNLIINSDERKLSWNNIPNFNQLPKCDDQTWQTYTSNLTKILPTMVERTVKISASSNDTISNKTIIIVAIVALFLIIIIVAILVYVYKRKTFKDRHEFSSKNKLILPNGNGNDTSMDTTSFNHNSVQNLTSIPYKPAYRAQSVSNSSNKGKSMVSLPLSMQSYFVCEEEENV